MEGRRPFARPALRRRFDVRRRMGEARSRAEALILTLLVLLLIAILTGAVRPLEAKDKLVRLLALVQDKDTSAFLFIGLMAVLPILGFPLSLFLLAAGAKFGIAGGIAVTAATMPLHLIAAYLLALWMRPHIRRLADRTPYDIPHVPDKKMISFTTLFFVLPGIPYALKNLLLPLGGVPFRYYLPIGWGVQCAMAVPFLGVGGSMAQMNPLVLGIFIGVMIAGYFLIRWLRTRYGDIVE